MVSQTTIAVTGGRPGHAAGSPLNPPVVFSSTYVSQGAPGDELVYARVDTETWQPLEQVLGQLEGSELPALVYGSGMAAVAAALSLMPDGGTIVVPKHAYQMALTLIDQSAELHNWAVRRVDIADTEQVITALDSAWADGPRALSANRSLVDSATSSEERGADGGAAASVAGTKRPANLLWIESPTNPMLEVADIPALCAAARERGITTVVDNTFATPLGQQPLAQGADVVLHSVTKYLAGHSDVVLGALVTADPDLRARLHSYRSLHGAIAGPMEVWLALRGLRTLPLRLERAQANAAELARCLSAHPLVAEVRHPSLPGDPGHERAQAQMTGFGAIIGLRPRPGAGLTPAQTADLLVAGLQLWVPATSLGGVESSIERRRRWPSEAPTVPEDLLRLSVGIEDVEDLWADLSEALNAIGQLRQD